MNHKTPDEIIAIEMKELARRLYVLRVERGITRLELSKASGVSEQLISRVERAKQFPSYYAARRIARVLDVKVSYLFDLGDAPRVVSVYPTLRETAEMLVKWVDSDPISAELPLDLLRALRSKKTQERVRAFLKLEIELPEVHRDFLARLEAAQVATIPPVFDSTRRTSPLGSCPEI